MCQMFSTVHAVRIALIYHNIYCFWIQKKYLLLIDDEKVNTTLNNNMEDGSVKYYSAFNGKERYVVDGHTGYISGITISKDGKNKVLSGCSAGIIRQWDGNRQKQIQLFEGSAQAMASPVEELSINFCGSFKMVFTLQSDGTMAASDAEKCTRLTSTRIPMVVDAKVGHSGVHIISQTDSLRIFKLPENVHTLDGIGGKTKKIRID